MRIDSNDIVQSSYLSSQMVRVHKREIKDPKCCKHHIQRKWFKSQDAGKSKIKNTSQQKSHDCCFFPSLIPLRPQHAVVSFFTTCKARKAFWPVAHWFWPSWKFWRVVWPAACFAMVSGSHLVHKAGLPCACKHEAYLFSLFCGAVNKRCQHLEVAGGINGAVVTVCLLNYCPLFCRKLWTSPRKIVLRTT